MPDLTIPGLPAPAFWAVPPVSASHDDGALTIVAPPLTDIFTDPKGVDAVATSPRLLFAPDPIFTLSAHVTVDFASTFDAGVLLLWVDAGHHAKLCFEYSPQGEPMIVSVVTNGISDDCNSVALARTDTHLRITRLGPALFAFHYSEDGKVWQMVRYFGLQKGEGLMAGFSSQSPTGHGCRAVFDAIRYTPTAVEDIRSGA
jgi:uncharacterized protein